MGLIIPNLNGGYNKFGGGYMSDGKGNATKIGGMYYADGKGNGIKIYSSFLPVGTSVFNDTNFVIDKDNVSGSVGNTYDNESMRVNVYKVITLEYPLSKYKNGVEINLNRSVAIYQKGEYASWKYFNFVNNGNLSIKIPKSSSEVSYYFDISGDGESHQGNITISINGQKLTMTNLNPHSDVAYFYPIISSITAY